MWQIFSTIVFFLVVMPVLIISDGVKKLNVFLKKHNKPEIDTLHVWLFALIFLLIILWSLGYR